MWILETQRQSSKSMIMAVITLNEKFTVFFISFLAPAAHIKDNTDSLNN